MKLWCFLPALAIAVPGFSQNRLTRSPDSARIATISRDTMHELEPIEVVSTRASGKAPFTRTEINRTTIAAENLGRDLPYLLNQTPSVVINSDAGNGIGYTGIHIRGTDPTRTNVTLNGIPYNDAESQGTYFVDIPDILSSTGSIQVQRGAGSSTNGTGAFGAAINISTNELHEQPYAESDNTYGSFNTWKNTVRAGSGLLSGHFTLDARLSALSSDGYIDRAASSLRSLYVSGVYKGGSDLLRFNFMTGKEKTYQAWYGVPEALLATNRTYNPAGSEKPGAPYDNQTDNYQQDHYQLFYTHYFSRWTVNVTSFLTRGRGYYEEYKADQALADYKLPSFIHGSDTIRSTDLIRQRWLDNYFYGQLFSLRRADKDQELTFGGGWTTYTGDHFGELIWGQVGVPKGFEYYRYPALKRDLNLYAKYLRGIGAGWNLYADLQYRHVRHRMDGFEDNPALRVDRSFDFINPKAGISFERNGWRSFFSYALAQKEPNRDDFDAPPAQQPKPEQLHDFEASLGWHNERFSWNATLYYMYYRDQLVLTGRLNDVGAYTRINVPQSHRAGIELETGWRIDPRLSLSGNLTLSDNRIAEFNEYLDDYDHGGQQAFVHRNTPISFSPSVIAAAGLHWEPAGRLAIDLPGKYVGRQYLDNTGNRSRSIGDYYNQDARASYTFAHLLFREVRVSVQVNNVFNRKYETNGSAYPYYQGGIPVNDNYYYPAAGTNILAAVNVTF